MQGKLLCLALLILVMTGSLSATGRCGQDIEVVAAAGDTLIDPLALYPRLPLEFRFGPVPGAIGYRMILSADEAFKDVVAEQVVRPSPWPSEPC